jgi:ribokinase
VYDVVTLGDVTLDILARVPSYPALGGDSLADRVDLRAGGSAANTAVVLSKFGLSVSIIARVGQDVFADYALADLREADVSLACLQRDVDAMTGLVFAAVTPDGERTFFSCRGANAKTSFEPADENNIRQAQLLHVSGYALVESPQRDAAHQAIQIAHHARVPVSVDIGVELMTIPREDILTLLPMVSMLCTNRAPAEWLTNDRSAEGAVETLLSYGPEVVALKLREQGCLIGSVAGLYRVPAFAVDPLDATGAGDSFDAGFILGRLGGLTVRASGLLANALGAMATTVTGGGISLPDPKGGLSFLEERRSQPAWQDWSEELRAVSEFLSHRSGG